MSFISYQVPLFTQFSFKKNGEEQNKHKLHCLKFNKTKNPLPPQNVEPQNRQKIPPKKQLVNPYRQGMIVEEGVAYRQIVVIRSCEFDPDKSATIESILNLLQETALNHVWMFGLLGDGFGATYGMVKNNLIWVVSRLRVQVDHYPISYRAIHHFLTE